MNAQVRNITCELIATFALTFVGAGAILVNAWTGGEPGLVGIALAHGIILSIAVSATMNISGGHVNPAVTMGLLATGRIKPGAAIGYIVGQCAGATIAGVLLAMIFRSLGAGGAEISGAQAMANSMLGTPNFGNQISAGMAVWVEAILTFLLVFAVFGTAVDPRAPKIGGFGIGLTVGVDILMGGPITGAAMNPARTIGTLLGGGSVTSALWSQHWVYWVGPVVGGVAAAWVYEALIMQRQTPR